MLKFEKMPFETLFTDAPAKDGTDNAFEEVQAMLIAKKIELNIYLTEPQLMDWDTVEHRTLARISGGLIYRITKDEKQVSEASQEKRLKCHSINRLDEATGVVP